MFWLFIALALLFISGGLLGARPSAGQQKVAALRATAFDSGLHVKLPVSLSFPALCVKSDYPYYCRRSKLRPDQGFVHLLKRPGADPTVTAIPSSAEIQQFQTLLMAMPASYTALYIGNNMIGIAWNESDAEQVPQVLIEAIDKAEALLSK